MDIDFGCFIFSFILFGELFMVFFGKRWNIDVDNFIVIFWYNVEIGVDNGFFNNLEYVFILRFNCDVVCIGSGYGSYVVDGYYVFVRVYMDII